MNDPIVSFDTLTIGEELDALGAASPAGPPKVLARLPRVTPPRPKTINRVDEAESPIPTAHLAEAMDESFALEAPAAKPTGDFFTTIRIDTVTPDRAVDPAPRPAQQPEPQPAAAPTMRVVHADDTTDALADQEAASWLLNLEASILPYSRWIALAAVIAALGLTLVLLRSGGGGETVDGAAPQDALIDSKDALADNEEFAPEWLSIPAPSASTTQPAAQATLVQAQPAATSAGPASIPRLAGQAQFTGEVLPVPAGQPQQVNVADARNADTYPRTTR